jgi:hypothetical protein
LLADTVSPNGLLFHHSKMLPNSAMVGGSQQNSGLTFGAQVEPLFQNSQDSPWTELRKAL